MDVDEKKDRVLKWLENLKNWTGHAKMPREDHIQVHEILEWFQDYTIRVRAKLAGSKTEKQRQIDAMGEDEELPVDIFEPEAMEEYDEREVEDDNFFEGVKEAQNKGEELDEYLAQAELDLDEHIEAQDTITDLLDYIEEVQDRHIERSIELEILADYFADKKDPDASDDESKQQKAEQEAETDVSQDE